MKINCWEFKKCGRQPGGDKVKDLGVCPAAIESRVDGVNNGVHGGRSCWAITGTLCGGEIQGTHAQKLGNCLNCDFYQLVQQEERPNFKTAGYIVSLIEQE
ncbi:MAG TPA: hypothetical protein VN429_12470 [Methanospirillum sp.]|uniref:two-CW domain-containing protein n=1 Tax=Methanospirillum sp. TaxID=45200 RepID=UPI002BA974F0|nr:hypothetical protein [Methanospirillum sp.]HWQ65227.1 hypothetical protein [Methanospirillum sp.]